MQPLRGSWSQVFHAQTTKTGDENATSLARDRIRCFAKKVLASIAPYTLISHTKMSIFFRKVRSSSYILESRPGKLLLETFSLDNN